ncbi:hypothetical protein FB451DRAFT_1177559 [Mycena latifolia]|nr:hypothetical protein FB451DRAFT_1177559 [Mycena latifolia]
MNAQGYVVKRVLLYPWGQVRTQLIDLIMTPPDITLGTTIGVAAWFTPSPSDCPDCVKPLLKIPALPSVAFTVFLSCTHDPETLEELRSNRAVAALLERLHNLQCYTCLGNVLVVKHVLPPTIQTRIAISRSSMSRSRISPTCTRSCAGFGLCDRAAAAPLDQPLNGTGGVDELELVANLTLRQERGSPSAPRTPRASPNLAACSGTSSSLRASAPPVPRTPSPSTPPPSYDATFPAQATTLYRFRAPAAAGYSPDWSEVGHATQGTPNSHVRAVSKHPKPRTKKGAYAVFRGREIGVFLTWDDVKNTISGVSFSLQQGYPSKARARVAFKFAQRNSWTCRANSSSALRLSPSNAPLPVLEDPTSNDPSSTLVNREPSDPWYIVYAGINLGVFGTRSETFLLPRALPNLLLPPSLECSLNVLGIKSSLHDSAPIYAEALAKFRRATTRGEVSVRRTLA